MLKAAMKGSRISGSKVIYMAPSSIHHIHPTAAAADDDCFGLTGSASPPSEDFLSGGTCCLELDRTVAELTAVGLGKVRHLKVQIVEKEGHWFALNSAQLELCRRLERDGLCAKVKVDVVPSHEVPLNVRNLMTLPAYNAVMKSKEVEEEEEKGQLTSKSNIDSDDDDDDDDDEDNVENDDDDDVEDDADDADDVV